MIICVILGLLIFCKSNPCPNNFWTSFVYSNKVCAHGWCIFTSS
jgi:hypothetical protein